MKKNSCKCELVLHYPDKQIPEKYENEFFVIYSYIENLINDFIYDTLPKDTKVSSEFFSGSDGTYCVWNFIIQDSNSDRFLNFLGWFNYGFCFSNKRKTTLLGDVYNMKWIKERLDSYNDEIIELIKDMRIDLTILTKVWSRIDGWEDYKE